LQIDTGPLTRLDSFPYRHRVSEVMSCPVKTVPPAATVQEASRLMAEAGVSSLVVTDAAGRVAGIVTERDVLRSVARLGPEGLATPLSRIMSSPVATVPADAYVYAALGRMDRIKVRHLLAVDARGRPAGMVTSRVLLRLRAGSALVLGDEVATATDAAAMDAVRRRLPALARELLAEGVDGLGVSAVTTAVLRDITARAAELAEQAMAAEGWGPAPAPWCLLILGSGGRGESFFASDQDNAIIHAGADKDDLWFAEAARRVADALNAAGIPYCKGEVMAVNPRWRRALAAWKAEVDHWVHEADGEYLLNVDIFLDFVPVYGDVTLAEELAGHVRARIAQAPRFLHALAASVGDMTPALGLFNTFRTLEGRIQLKRAGLLPLVSAIRLLALKHRLAATPTAERLKLLAEGGHLPEDEARNLAAAHELMMRLMIRQQITDIDVGLPPSGRLEPRLMTAAERRRLKEAFRRIKSLHWVLENALSTV
jgi:signal-transduction protein with cAMP-binding, CBS, and nucleotidyltransferase domain